MSLLHDKPFVSVTCRRRICKMGGVREYAVEPCVGGWFWLLRAHVTARVSIFVGRVAPPPERKACPINVRALLFLPVGRLPLCQNRSKTALSRGSFRPDKSPTSTPSEAA